jgi:hypothetical protein
LLLLLLVWCYSQAQEVGFFVQRYRVDQPRTQTEGQGNLGDGLHNKQEEAIC